MSPKPINHGEIEIRSATDADQDAIIEVAGAALGWSDDDPRVELFRWKHLENPFGSSSMWVAVDGERLAAFRAMLAWEFEDATHGPQRAARAVDTATHPDYQGQGLFTRLTRHAIDELEADGVDFIFNTPNAQSRPGYLKMGWVDVGRVPIAVAPRSPASVVRLLRSRVSAAKLSRRTEVGVDPVDVLSDQRAVDGLLESQPKLAGLATRRSVPFLQWRYDSGPLAYRVLLRGSAVDDGFVVFRLRQRGSAVEATICDVLVPEGDRRLERDLLAAVMRSAQPDYLIRVSRQAVSRPRWVRLPGQGPRLTWRGLRRIDQPPRSSWDLRLGDIELF